MNFFVVAESFDDARAKAKLNEEFKRKRMHVDGLQEIRAIDGCRIEAALDAQLAGQSTGREQQASRSRAEARDGPVA